MNKAQHLFRVVRFDKNVTRVACSKADWPRLGVRLYLRLRYHD